MVRIVLNANGDVSLNQSRNVIARMRRPEEGTGKTCSSSGSVVDMRERKEVIGKGRVVTFVAVRFFA